MASMCLRGCRPAQCEGAWRRLHPHADVPPCRGQLTVWILELVVPAVDDGMAWLCAAGSSDPDQLSRQPRPRSPRGSGSCQHLSRPARGADPVAGTATPSKSSPLPSGVEIDHDPRSRASPREPSWPGSSRSRSPPSSSAPLRHRRRRTIDGCAETTWSELGFPMFGGFMNVSEATQVCMAATAGQPDGRALAEDAAAMARDGRIDPIARVPGRSRLSVPRAGR